MPTYHPCTQPGVLPERGNPVCTPALFLVQDAGTEPREAQPAALLLRWPRSQLCHASTSIQPVRSVFQQSVVLEV